MGKVTRRQALGPREYATVIDPSKGYGTWDGWGAALSWWTNIFGMDDTLADLFYTRETVKLHGKELPGLGLNIVRYNVGACTRKPAGTQPERMHESKHIARRKQMDGYWLNWDSEDPASTSWDWWVDSNQRNMMWKARDRGANLFEMFSVSPMWWMCKNHNPSGGSAPKSDNNAAHHNNLQPWNYRQYARYLATVAQYARDHWGVKFNSVEPFNEPVAQWWLADGNQEGCNITPDVQQQIISHLRAELDARGLRDTIVAASDENKYREATSTWTSFSAATKAMAGRVNVHGYEQKDNRGTQRRRLYEAAPHDKHDQDKMALWQTEYGEGDKSGLSLAYNLSLDMRYLHPSAWCYWQPVDSDGWGLIDAKWTDKYPPHPRTSKGNLRGATNRYFVLAQYVRHIRPGMRIIDSGDQATVAAYDADRHRLVLVTVRGETQQRITYNLSRFTMVAGADGGIIRRWTTDANPVSVGRRYVARSDVRLSGKGFSVDFEPRVIQTFEIDNVTI